AGPFWIGKRALVEDAERAGGDAVAAAVADVFLDDDRAELCAEERARRADVQARGVRAALADVGGHQPAQPAVAVRRRPLGRDAHGLALLAEGDVAPAVRAERRGVIVGLAGPDQAVLGDHVPLLARHLAGLAADADRRVGKEPHPRLGALAVRVRPRGRLARN